jgi:predicted glutamine amidotransferase
VVSEPLDAEEFTWHEVPDSSLVRVDDGGVHVQPLELCSGN